VCNLTKKDIAGFKHKQRTYPFNIYLWVWTSFKATSVALSNKNIHNDNCVMSPDLAIHCFRTSDLYSQGPRFKSLPRCRQSWKVLFITFFIFCTWMAVGCFQLGHDHFFHKLWRWSCHSTLYAYRFNLNCR